MAHIISNSKEYDEIIKEGITLVDFYADWCGPCRMLAPFIDQLSNEYQGKAKVVKVNVDNAQDVAFRYGISSIPTIIVVKDGKVVNSHVGFTTYDGLKEMIDAIL